MSCNKMLDNLLKSFLYSRDINTAKKIMDYCIQEKMYAIGLILGKYISELFNDINILTNLALCAYMSKEYKVCYDTYERLLEFNIIDMNTVDILLTNQIKCITHIADQYIYYSPEIVERLVSAKAKQFPTITFTVTTCKRYDLFEKTMNSFLNCCVDIDKIDTWLCVDDNSSDEDREKMKKNYPFFEFYFKTKNEKGHPQSMNIIKKKVKTPYIFHIEDDWKFFSRRKYITECLEIIGTNPSIGQCLINKNYAEVESIKIVGGFFSLTNTGKRYYIHEHCATREEYDIFNKKYGGLNNCAYWPHFSFRPSLLRTEVLHKLGDFNETIGHFEMDYSYRYRNNGYISAFLEGLYCLHIGRLTTERHDNTRANAYILNDEKQFSEKVPSLNLNMKTYVINLDRRPDRWEAFQKHEEPKYLNYERFSAIDGSKLENGEQLQRIFDGNDYNMREGMVGCAMSHIKLYIELVNSSYEFFCIFEDDIEFVPNFKEKFLHLYKNLPPDWDMCYLGHHLWNKSEEYFDKTALPTSERWDTIKSLKYSIGGTGGYIISKKGANAMLEFINVVGMTNGIDTMQQKAADTLHIYYCKPHLIYSENYTQNNKCDTDIQYNLNSLTIHIEKRLLQEEEFYSKFTNIVKTSVEPNFESLKEVTFYTGTNIRDALKKCKKPCYTLNYRVMIIVPEPNEKILNERYFERLKKSGVYNIDDALRMKRFKVIPYGVHIHDAIKRLSSTVTDYPFDTIDEGNLEIFNLFSEMVLKMDDKELENFVKNLCDPEKNIIYLQSYNNKPVLKNVSYNINFPHEDVDQLVPIYIRKFKNFRDTIIGKNDVVTIIHCTRWEHFPVKNFYYMIDMFKRYNPNVRVVTINGIESSEKLDSKYSDCLYREYVDFEKDFRISDWPNNKVIYDQTTFKNNVIELLKKYV